MHYNLFVPLRDNFDTGVLITISVTHVLVLEHVSKSQANHFSLRNCQPFQEALYLHGLHLLSDKTTRWKGPWVGKDWHTGYRMALWEAKARTEGRNIKALTKAKTVETNCLLACSFWLAQLAFLLPQDHLPRHGTTQGPGPFSIN